MKKPADHDLLSLPAAEFITVKEQLLTSQTVIERQTIKDFDAQFAETVTLGQRLLKWFWLGSLAVYLVINLAAIIVVIVKGTLTNPVNNLVGLGAIGVIMYAIFGTINTKQKKTVNALFIKGEQFIFNFNDRVVATPYLFYMLPSSSLTRITMVTHGWRKGQVFGSVVFTFQVFGYQVHHGIRYTNLSAVKDYLGEHLPALTGCLVIDGQGTLGRDAMLKRPRLTANLTALGLLVAAGLLFGVPYALHFYCWALSVTAALCLVTGLLVGLGSWLRAGYLTGGLVIGGVFLIIGWCVPGLIIELSGLSLGAYLLNDCEVLLPIIFGIVGIGMYGYGIAGLAGKINYRLKTNKNSLWQRGGVGATMPMYE